MDQQRVDEYVSREFPNDFKLGFCSRNKNYCCAIDAKSEACLQSQYIRDFFIFEVGRHSMTGIRSGQCSAGTM
jgi:hypothetical protein